jgi:hypothetical protein
MSDADRRRRIDLERGGDSETMDGTLCAYPCYALTPAGDRTMDRANRQIGFTKEEIERLEMFRHAVLLGPAELLELLSPPDCHTKDRARDYYVHKCLVEVQKVGFAISRWIDSVNAVTSNEKASKTVVSLSIEAIVDEQSVWRRKLAEILSSAICFSAANEQSYYHHHFLVAEYVRVNYDSKEQEDSFGSRSATIEEYARKLWSEIDALERTGSIQPARCWYLSKPVPVNSIPCNHWRKLESSAKQRLMRALQDGTNPEKRALGFCYDNAFSNPSAAIHFSLLPRPREPNFGDFKFGCS